MQETKETLEARIEEDRKILEDVSKRKSENERQLAELNKPKKHPGVYGSQDKLMEAADLIYANLTFHSTNEGYEYWSTVHKKLLDYAQGKA